MAGRPLVDRSELVRRVVDSGASVVLLVAPAGFGKTHVARLLAADLGAGTPADCRDMLDLPSAVRAIVRSLAPFDGEFEERIANYLVALNRDDADHALWLDVLDEALERIDGNASCWLENAESLDVGGSAAAAVARLVASGKRRLIVCSRIPLRVAGLSRVPPNERYEIGAVELGFTNAESAALFPADIQGSWIEAALKLANGWPIAVLTYARAAREGRLAPALEAAGASGAAHDLRDYSLNEALSSFSPCARSVLAAVAQLRDATVDEVRLIAGDVQSVMPELDGSPFVSYAGAAVTVHPLAASALAPLYPEGRELLRGAAASIDSPLRAAQLYVAGGDAEAAAKLLDTTLAPFFVGESRREVLDILGSIGRDVLIRHAPTWCATISFRAYAMNQHDLLAEAQGAWKHLAQDAPLLLRIGVGLTYINSLLLLNDTKTADEIFANLQAAIGADDSRVFEKVLVGYRAFADLRAGQAIDVAKTMASLESLIGANPESQASALNSVVAPEAFYRGERDLSRRQFARCIEIARGVASPIYLVIGLCSAAFYAWLSGETSLFEAHVEELRHVSTPNVLGGTRHFIGCATSSDPVTTRTGFEVPYLRAFAYLIAAARENTAEKKQTAARLALDAAEEDGQPWLRALCYACIGWLDATKRHGAFTRTRELASGIAYVELRSNLESLTMGNLPERWCGLRAIVERAADVVMQVSFGATEVRLIGEALALSRREMELLLALALHGGPRDRATLAAMLWPDTPEREGGRAVAVYVGRLRKRLGDPELISSSRDGYRLACRVDVDLDRLEELAEGRRKRQADDPELEKAISSKHHRLSQWVATSDWLAPYVRRYDSALDRIRRSRALKAEANGDTKSARRYAGLIAAEAHWERDDI